jgi:hypothetical protein
MEQAGKSVTQTTSFGDYRAVKVSTCHNMIQNVGFDIGISEIKINEGVTDADLSSHHQLI